MKPIVTTLFTLGAMGISLFHPVQSCRAKEPREANMLVFLSHSFASAIDVKYKEKLEQAGYTITSALYSDPNVTWDIISEANVLVLTWVPMRSYLDQVEHFQEKSRLFYRFLKAGGGILVFCESNYDQVIPVINAFLSPLAAEILPEQVVDETHVYRQRAYLQYFFSWTTNIAPHEISSGISELWYPLGGSMTGGGRKTFAIKPAGTAWKIIVRGNPSAYSIDPTTRHKTYLSAPPIVAARTYGRGRIVILPSHATFWIHAPYHRIWEQIVHRRGEGEKFLANIYDWLGEPSRNNPDVGRAYRPIGPNLVPNPVFDVCPDARVPLHWEGGLSTTGEVTFSFDTNIVHTGSHALRMEAAVLSTGEYYSQPVMLEKGGLYRLSGWIKSSKLYTNSDRRGYLNGASIALRTGKGMQGWFFQTMDADRQAIRRTKDWTYVTTIFRWEHATGTVHVICSFSGWMPATGQVWFDHVELYQLDR